MYNAESPTPMYVYNTPYRTICQTADDDILVRRYITPLGAFPLLCSWHTDEVAKFSERQNQSVQLRLYVYMSSPPLPY